MIGNRALVGAVLLSLNWVSLAQGTRADYERAAALPGRWQQSKVTHARVEPRWIGGGPRFWFRSDVGEGKWEFVIVDCAAGTRGPLFDHAKLAEGLAKAAGGDIRA